MYISIYICRKIGGQSLRTPNEDPRTGGAFFDFGGLLKINRSGRVLHSMGPNKQVRTQQLRASGAVYLSRWSFWWSIRGHWRSPGVPRASPGGLRDVPGGVPEACPEAPGASPGVPGACPGDPWESRGLRGRPRHPQDPLKMIP